MNPKRKTIGLALGSGDFRGAAHIGVIKALVENNIPIDYISGSSIGAWVGAHFALFQDLERLENEFLFKQRSNLALLSDISRRGGLISGNKVEKFLRKIFNAGEFKDTKIPVKITATDLVRGEPVVFAKGDLAQAVRASISVPLVFKPVKFKDKILIDGGATNPVPDNIVKDMGADIVIGVNLYGDYEYTNKNPSTVKVIMRSMEIVLAHLAKSNMKHCDVIIKPDISDLHTISRYKKYINGDMFNFMLKAGEKAVIEALPEIRKLIV
jgi:NTE family protein